MDFAENTSFFSIILPCLQQSWKQTQDLSATSLHFAGVLLLTLQREEYWSSIPALLWKHRNWSPQTTALKRRGEIQQVCQQTALMHTAKDTICRPQGKERTKLLSRAFAVPFSVFTGWQPQAVGISWVLGKLPLIPSTSAVLNLGVLQANPGAERELFWGCDKESCVPTENGRKKNKTALFK